MKKYVLFFALSISVLFVSIFFLANVATAEVGPLRAGEVLYETGGVRMKGYIAYDPAIEDKRPGVLVVHEWWGHNDYARKRARMLARMGYTALAVDMYGDGKTAEHPDDAGRFAGEVMKNMPVGVARFNAALKILKEHKTTDSERIAAIGYCFGGAVVLHMARIGTDLDVVASFHGSLRSIFKPAPGEVKAKLLVFNGAEDPMTTQTHIDALKAEMKAAGADLSFYSYEGVRHSFTNPDADKYGAKADKESWTEMSRVFKEVFGK